MGDFKKIAHIRLTDVIYQALDKMVLETRRSRSDIIREALRIYLRNHGYLTIRMVEIDALAEEEDASNHLD